MRKYKNNPRSFRHIWPFLYGSVAIIWLSTSLQYIPVAYPSAAWWCCSGFFSPTLIMLTSLFGVSSSWWHKGDLCLSIPEHFNVSAKINLIKLLNSSAFCPPHPACAAALLSFISLHTWVKMRVRGGAAHLWLPDITSFFFFIMTQSRPNWSTLSQHRPRKARADFKREMTCLAVFNP